MSSRVPLYIIGLSLVKWEAVVSVAQPVVNNRRIDIAEINRLLLVMTYIAPGEKAPHPRR